MADVTISSADKVNNASGLAEVLTTRFKEYEANRQALFDTKWEKNREAFMSVIKTGEWKASEAKGWRSTTFIGKTRQKISSAVALILNMAMQKGKIPLRLKLAPFGQYTSENVPEDLKKWMEDRLAENQALLDQQLLDVNADREYAKNLLSMCLYGLTWAKRPVVTVSRSYYAPEPVEGIEMEDAARLSPEGVTWTAKVSQWRCLGWEQRSVWDVFPDVENMHDHQGSAGIFERQFRSPNWLRKKLGKKFFNDVAINRVLEGSKDNAKSGSSLMNTATLRPELRDIPNRKDKLCIKEFWGREAKDVVEKYERERQSLVPGAPMTLGEPANIDPGEELEIYVMMATDEVVGFARVEPGTRPWEMAVCEDNLDEVAGRSIADNVEDIQKTLNGAVRGAEDNIKFAGNSELAVIPDMLERMDDERKPGGRISVKADVEDIRKAIMPMRYEDNSGGLFNLIKLFLQFFEEMSLIPDVAQGMPPRGSPTAFQISTQQQNANKTLANIIRNADEGLIEPMGNALVRRNMEDPDVPFAKGNYMVEAVGYQNYLDRITTIDNLRLLISLGMESPLIGNELRFRKIIENILLLTDQAPEDLLKSEEEKQAGTQAELEAQGGMAPAGPSPEQVEADTQARQVETDKVAADAEGRRAETEIEIEKLKIERARLIMDLEKSHEEAGAVK